MLQDLINLLEAMKTNSEYKKGWDKLEPLIGLSGTVSITWPAWRLKLVTFRMPKEWDGEVDSAESLQTIDNLYWDENKLVWITEKNAHEYKTDMQRATVADVIDEFLSGNWTPPWKCGFCVARHKGNAKPKF